MQLFLIHKTWKALSMPVKLFVLGLPGSGKSAIARSIIDHVKHRQIHGSNDRQWSARRFNDYTILLDMYQKDIENKQFQPAYPSGFDVHDWKAFDDALKAFESQIKDYIDSLKLDEKKLVIVEFSRNNYQHAFKQISSTFLQDSYFIYLGADVNICKQRVDKRRFDPSYPEDNFPVSAYIFETYYTHDDGFFLDQILSTYGVSKQRILLLDNNGEEQLITATIKTFTDTILFENANDNLEGISANIPNMS